jgi:hypothetical protein
MQSVRERLSFGKQFFSGHVDPESRSEEPEKLRIYAEVISLLIALVVPPR